MFPEDKKIKVLYIDDEVNNLLSFQSSFRRKYKVFIASSGAEGLNILNDERDIQVIIALLRERTFKEILDAPAVTDPRLQAITDGQGEQLTRAKLGHITTDLLAPEDSELVEIHAGKLGYLYSAHDCAALLRR